MSLPSSMAYFVPCDRLLQKAYCFSFLTELTDLRDSLKDVSDTVLSLRSLGQKLRAGLDEARNNLTKAKEDCNNDPPSVEAGACDKIPAWDDLQAEADFNQVTEFYTGCQHDQVISIYMVSNILIKTLSLQMISPRLLKAFCRCL